MAVKPGHLNHRLLGSGLVFLAGLVGLSIFLGVHRLFQVDEVLYASLARYRSTGGMAPFIGSVPFILLGPLTWLAGTARDGAGVLVALRMPFVGLMWLNAVLMVKGAGLKLRSGGGLLALLLASTLAPMWDYGFEIRHDVPLVTATLALWWLVQTDRPRPLWRLFLAGVIAAAMEWIAFKGFMFALPLLGLAIHRTRPMSFRQFTLRSGSMLAGVALGGLAGSLVQVLAGTWGLAVGSYSAATAYSIDQVVRFAPWPTLLRFLTQAPLLACASLGVLLAPFLQPGPHAGWLKRLLDAPWFPEWAFTALALILLLANPTPFPYNLLHVAPACFIGVLRFREPILEALAQLTVPARQMAVAALVLLQGLPWALATARHLDMDNTRQFTLIRLAEAMTDPALHRVFDGSGLVTTRKPIGEEWLIHSFTIHHFFDGSWPSVRSLLARNPTPIILPNYRIEGLPKEDHDFMGNHYLNVASDFWVLGTQKGPGSSPWDVLAEGRYQLMVAPQPAPANHPWVEIDGKAVATGIASFTKGIHPVQVPAGAQFLAVWLGPNLQSFPNLGPAPHPLFVNWY